MEFATPAEVWEQIQDVTRVHVVDETGTKRWKSPENIAATDKVILKNDGKPLTMSGEIGRPRKDKTDEAKDNEEQIGKLIADTNRRRTNFLKQDDLLRIAKKNPDDPKMMDLILRELSSEAASLKFERKKLEDEGKEVSEVSSRRTRILGLLGDQWLKRQERLQEVGVVDLNSPAMVEFMKAFAETLSDVMEELRMRPEVQEAVINRLAKRIDDEWKVAVRKRMKNVSQS